MKINISISAATAFTKGQRVIAKIKKDEWYAGFVKTLGRTGGYTIQFNDGDVVKVDQSDVKNIKAITKVGKKTSYSDAEAKALIAALPSPKRESLVIRKVATNTNTDTNSDSWYYEKGGYPFMLSKGKVYGFKQNRVVPYLGNTKVYLDPDFLRQCIQIKDKDTALVLHCSLHYHRSSNVSDIKPCMTTVPERFQKVQKVLYRGLGISHKDYEKLQKGGILDDRSGISSWTTAKKVATLFAGNDAEVCLLVARKNVRPLIDFDTLFREFGIKSNQLDFGIEHEVLVGSSSILPTDLLTQLN